MPGCETGTDGLIASAVFLEGDAATVETLGGTGEGRGGGGSERVAIGPIATDCDTPPLGVEVVTRAVSGGRAAGLLGGAGEARSRCVDGGQAVLNRFRHLWPQRESDI